MKTRIPRRLLAGSKPSRMLMGSAILLLCGLSLAFSLSPPFPIRAQTRSALLVRTVSPIFRTVADLRAAQAARGTTRSRPLIWQEPEGPDRSGLPQSPAAVDGAQWPVGPAFARPGRNVAAQTLGTQFDGATGPTETGAFPPDTMGAVGPTQFVVFLNGRIRTFNKTTGAADGMLNVDPDVFFASVITPAGAGEVSFTSDPQVRYDRLTKRWFLTIIDVTLNGTGAITKANRVLIALTDAASNGTISGTTTFTLYQFQGDSTLFTDYESLGVDASALYIGGDMFTLPGAFDSTKGFVIPKAPLLTGSPATVWAFSGLVATSTGSGPFAPRGVDNPDPANTGVSAVGYFIGVDNATFNTLMLRRITNPGSLGPAPTISANISVATPLTTRFPVLVPHLGNTGGTGGRLDSLDDRLYAASIRNGRLWTAHNIGVNNTGVAGAANNRCAARWYELQNLDTTPTVRQSGTLYDNNATNDANQRNYWIPSVAVSGQGHVAMGTSIAGTNERVNAFTVGRLAGDTLGTMRAGPGGTALPGYTASSTAYNPPGDPGGPSRRWGDYSFTSVDPDDDMTLWTIQEYCNGTNTYGVRAVQLIAPPPAVPSAPSPSSVPQNVASTSVTITGDLTPNPDAGFFDPGPDTLGPGFAKHLSASVTGGVIVVTSTYNNPTQVTLNISTVGASTGTKDVTICNPDNQCRTGVNILTITPGGVVTDTPTPTKTFTPTSTFTPSNTPTFTFTPSNTPTRTNTPTATSTPTRTPDPNARDYFPIDPCRLIDTRNPAGPTGGPSLAGGTSRDFPIVNNCGVPPTAKAIAINLAVTNPTGSGNIVLFPAGNPAPLAATINYSAGQTRANNAVIPLGVLGNITAQCNQGSGTTADLVIDVNGYFQ